MSAAPGLSQASRNPAAQRAGVPVAPMMNAVAQMVDVVFPLRGQAIARDHAQALRLALVALWPWLEHDPVAAIHPLKLVPGADLLGLLSQRTRLVLRVPADRTKDLMAAGGLRLDLQGQALQLGEPQLRALRPYSAMYAYRVAADGADEGAFMAQVERELALRGLAAARVCGKHQQLQLPDRTLDVFSLMLHEMTPQHALQLQQMWSGQAPPARLWGVRAAQVGGRGLRAD